MPPMSRVASAQQRPPLPLDPNGRVDLERLELPTGISITRIHGATPDRKYFPSNAAEYSAGGRDQSVLPLPGSIQPPTPALSSSGTASSKMIPENSQAPIGYSALEGMPAGLNGPNVIVVDTSSLKTREEEEKVRILPFTSYKCLIKYLPYPRHYRPFRNILKVTLSSFRQRAIF